MIMMDMTGNNNNNNNNYYFYCTHLFVLTDDDYTNRIQQWYMELNQLLVLNDFKENWTTILYTTDSQSSVENRETPPTSMVASEMLQSN